MTHEHYPRIHRPCAECPFRTDVPVGRFPPERFEALRNTVGGTTFPQPMFGCHKTPEGGERACAGWLATCGADNLTVRLNLVLKRLPLCALQRGDDWPELYPTYDAMAVANGARRYGHA